MHMSFPNLNISKKLLVAIAKRITLSDAQGDSQTMVTGVLAEDTTDWVS